MRSTDLTPEASGEALKALLGSPTIASKRWVFEQYDTHVRTNTVAGPGATDAAVVRIKGAAGARGSERGLAMKTDCNGRYVYLNPRRGGQIAVAEAARNVVCAGGEPLAITNCLNFGNPYKPEVYWQFAEAVGGMGDACRAFGTPVTGGNVSFYNENPEGAIYPTPTIGMVGLVEDVDADATTAAFPDGAMLLLVSPEAWTHTGGIEASEYLMHVHGLASGDAPHLDLDEEKAVQSAVLAAIRAGLVLAAHDVSDGGLGVCLAEGCIHGDIGAEVVLPDASGARLDAVLFGEAQSRIVLAVAPEVAETVQALAAEHGAQATLLGTTGGDRLHMTADGETVLDEAVADLARPYHTAIPDAMGEGVVA